MSTHGGPPPGGPQQPGPAQPPYPPTQQQQYGAPPQESGGAQAVAANAADFARRHISTPETKEFFKTSEFLVWVLTIVMVLIAANQADDFGSAHAWTLVTTLSFAYIISRGISKAGTRRGSDDGGGGFTGGY